MFSKNGKVKIEIQYDKKGLYFEDITIGKLEYKNEGLMGDIIESNFKPFVKENIDWKITKGSGKYPFRLEIRSDLIQRDYLKTTTEEIIKEYNESR